MVRAEEPEDETGHIAELDLGTTIGWMEIGVSTVRPREE